ncbi:MAG: PhoH family protein [Verrucomicrobia bacterium]|jgi:PhoH-like ATPase|nr:PhoH family protein [Verrucomicrobiota bacterium]
MTTRKSKKARPVHNKTFVLDTNVLLHNAESIEAFGDNNVVIPMAVIEELDSFKSHNDELGRNARHVIRRIDALRTEGNLRDGVPMPNGGMLQIRSAAPPSADDKLTKDIPDNRILRLAYELHNEDKDIIFVSKDINARLKADALGLQAVDFEKEKINFDDLYSGYSEVDVPLATINGFFKERIYKHSKLGGYPNEFIRMSERTNRARKKKTALARVIEPGTLTHLSTELEEVWNVRARNREQRMALELLMDPNVQIVTLVGQAGTGKTLLALAAALHCTLKHHRYDRILVSRPIIPMGKDIGYLPGPKEEKLIHWMQPIFDNLTYLMHDAVTPSVGKKKGKVTARDRIDALFDNSTVVLEALTYIRGRSIPGQYVIVDEAQNLTPHEVKTIVSRAGENTKMVLTGDPYQIDNPYLDASSNGLTYATERLKAQTIHGHMTLKTSERSALAAIAAEYL